MTTLREAAQQALEAWDQPHGINYVDFRPYMDALRAALAEPVQEPVTWRWGYRSVTTGEMDWRGYVEIPSHPNLRSPAIIMEPLYTAPPQRKPLTDEKLDELAMDKDGLPNSHIEFARVIEQAHGIK